AAALAPLPALARVLAAPVLAALVLLALAAAALAPAPTAPAAPLPGRAGSVAGLGLAGGLLALAGGRGRGRAGVADARLADQGGLGRLGRRLVLAVAVGQLGVAVGAAVGGRLGLAAASSPAATTAATAAA